ncbi:MAG: hypothetical protein MI919_10540, partial [Holophagales bacterium]|nr:hypothetical protein [Holophagales bacterium]
MSRLGCPPPILPSLLCLALLSAASAPATGQAVFVNELHYDDSGVDAGEAVEVAGPAGTDLTGWSIELYNGNGGALYDTFALSGTIPDDCAGLGTVFVNTPGIQNGGSDPDGLALVDDMASVVQFLSYEGSFTATSGTANGMTSTDIGVEETSSTPEGQSLQLTGSGATYGDFAWTGPAASSFDACNAGQSFTGGGPADPVINELVVNHTGADTFEFVEIYGDPSTDYSAFTLVEIEGDGASAGLIDDFIQVVGMTDAAGIWVSAFQNSVIENGSVSLLLVEGFSGAVGNDTDNDNDGTLDTTFWTRIVDDVAVSDGDGGDRTYSATVLAPNYDGVGFVPGGASRLPDGTDTDTTADWLRNDFDGQGIPALEPGTPAVGEALNTPGAPNMAVPPTAFTGILINESDSDTVGTEVEEFIELYDGGLGSTALDGLVVVLYNGNGDTSYNAFDLDGFSTDANGFFVIGGTGIPSADLTVAGSGWLQNGADAIAVYEADATDFPNGTAVTTTGLLEALVYDTNDADDAGLLPLLNAAQPQVNEGANGANATESVYRCPDGAGGQRNTSTYQAGMPTPGLANDCVVVMPASVLINELDADMAGT